VSAAEDGPRVLVIDDEQQIRRALGINLKARGFVPLLAADGTSGLRLASKHHPDAVIVDLGLPDIDGVEVIEGIRGWSEVPILVLSVREGERDKVEALDAGADDYVTKPFGIEELMARLRAVVRRAQPPGAEEPVVDVGGFTVDLADHRVLRDGAEVALTPTEWGVLAALARSHGRLVTQKQLLQEVWGPQYGEESHYLRVYMGQLRRKLEADPSRPVHLITEAGMGYRLETVAGDAPEAQR